MQRRAVGKQPYISIIRCGTDICFRSMVVQSHSRTWPTNLCVPLYFFSSLNFAFNTQDLPGQDMATTSMRRPYLLVLCRHPYQVSPHGRRSHERTGVLHTRGDSKTWAWKAPPTDRIDLRSSVPEVCGAPTCGCGCHQLTNIDWPPVD